MSTVPYEQQKLYTQIILSLHGNTNEPSVLLADTREPSISYDVYEFVNWNIKYYL